MNAVYNVEALARAMREQERLELFDFNVANSHMHLTWSMGSATGGYQEMTEAIAEVVSERWLELRDAARAKAAAKVERLKKLVRAELSEPV